MKNEPNQTPRVRRVRECWVGGWGVGKEARRFEFRHRERHLEARRSVVQHGCPDHKLAQPVLDQTWGERTSKWWVEGVFHMVAGHEKAKNMFPMGNGDEISPSHIMVQVWHGVEGVLCCRLYHLHFLWGK